MPIYERIFVRSRDAMHYTVRVEAPTAAEANHLTWLFLLQHHDKSADHLSWFPCQLREIDR